MPLKVNHEMNDKLRHCCGMVRVQLEGLRILSCHHEPPASAAEAESKNKVLSSTWV